MDPATVQMVVSEDEYATVRPDDAVPFRDADPADSFVVLGALKVIVCEPLATVHVRWTEVAAAQVALPAWEAVTVQEPAPTYVTVLPDTVQTVVVEDE